MEKCFDEGTLQAFLDNELSSELSQAVARHIVDCDPCAFLLAEVEEETAFAFAALEQEFNTLVPTQRLWTKINQSIESQSRPRGAWQNFLTLISGLSFTNPHVLAFGSLLMIVGVVSTLIIVKNENLGDVAVNRATVPAVQVAQTERAPIVAPPAGIQTAPVNDANDDSKFKPAASSSPQFRVEKAVFAEKDRKPIVKPGPPTTSYAPVPQYVDGEESYVTTIARLEKTVNDKKDEVLKPSARFSYEKDLAVVNDTISKMKREVKKNPKNQDAKQILFASYQNKIELLNSVTQRDELMASLR
jgi:hypothetical protein